LTVVWGLLYTAALHRPTDSDCTSLPPSPSLHVHVVGYSSLCGCSLAESSDIHPCLDGSLLHCAHLVQRLACQADVDYTSLHERVDGLFPWPAVNSCICFSSDNSNLESLTSCLNHLTHDQLCLLWHQCLGHLHSQRVSGMHKFAIGVPSVPINTDLDQCPICATAKLHKAAHGQVSS